MSRLGVCAHCSAGISPRRVLRMSRRKPYVCPSCGGRSAIAARSGVAAVAAYVAAIALPLFALDALGGPRALLFAGCVVATILIPIVFARFCRFDAWRGGGP